MQCHVHDDDDDDDSHDDTDLPSVTSDIRVRGLIRGRRKTGSQFGRHRPLNLNMLDHLHGDDDGDGSENRFCFHKEYSFMSHR